MDKSGIFLLISLLAVSVAVGRLTTKDKIKNLDERIKVLESKMNVNE